MDGTVGPAQNLAGPDFGIGAELGTIRGTNLFHSFQTFNIHTGESATFTGPDSIDNVISRVTGGEISTINGLLRSEVGHADFYFINPSGVVFGPNAQVDVPGAFHISTATELRFGDDTAYSATDIGASTLSLAQPESFGFLSPQPASITVNGSQLEFVPESRESLSAGNVTIQDGASLVSAGGDVRITAVGESGGVVPLAAEPVDSAGSGTAAITGASTINVSGTEGSASVALCGGQVEVADSVVAADHSGSEDAGGQILLEADSVRVINSDIRARVLGAGKGNDILVVAEDLEVDATTATNGRSRLTTRVMPGASGAAGDVRVEAADVTLTNGGQLSSIIEDGANGQGGAVTVQAGNTITIEGSNETGFHSGILAFTLGPGNSGSVTIEADELNILNEGAVWAFTQASGAAGDVTISANHSMLLDNANIDTSTYDTGAAGKVVIKTGSLSMLDSGIDVFSYSRANAGTVEVIADEIHVDNTTEGTITAFNAANFGGSSLTPGSEFVAAEEGRSGTIALTASEIIFDHGADISIITNAGDGGSIVIRADELSILNGSNVLSTTSGPGRGGGVQIEVTGALLIEGGRPQNGSTSSGSIVTSAVVPNLPWSPSETGPAGAISISAETLIVGQDSEILSTSFSNASAGPITLNVGALEIKDGGEISSSAGANGPGAAIVITAQKAVSVHGVDPASPLDPSEITADAAVSSNASGKGGSILIEAPVLLLEQGGELSSVTGSSGAGGAIKLEVDKVVINSGGEINTSTSDAAPAGTIHINADSVSINKEGGESLLWTLQETGLFSKASLDATGDAGSIDVTAESTMELLSGAQISTSTSSAGDAGTITISAGKLLIDNGMSDRQVSTIRSLTKNAATGTVGRVQIAADSLVINGGEISIAANQTLPENLMGSGLQGLILVNSGKIHLDNGARITAESTGNVPAGAVEIHAGDLLLEGESRITTESTEADGGPIRIGGQNIVMRDSLITTSVEGLSGDGGNISVNADALVLQGGFIQANTAAPMARGGDIFIDTNALVASYGLLEVGGIERLAFQPGSGRNVIQAAAPGGAYGAITITSPGLDISGALVPLSTHFADVPRLIGDPCVAAAGQTNSSLIQRGRGGLPAGPEQPAAPFFGGERLDRLLEPEAGPSVNDSQAGEGTNSPTGGQRGR